MSVHRNVITNYSQQDATFLEFVYFYRRSTCFRRFLRPPSGAHNCTYSFRYCQPILLLAATVDDICMSVHRNVITNYSQQDATFLEFVYFYRRSTCFRRFLRPSTRAHNCTYSFRYCQPILLLAATVDEIHLIHGSS